MNAFVRHRRATRLGALALLVLFALAVVYAPMAYAPIAEAHAKLVRADPAPGTNVGSAPAQVQLWFDEPIGISFSDVQVLDSSRQRVDTGTIALAPDDPMSVIAPLKGISDGTYTVIWKVLSDADGHITRGVFAFNVGNVAGPAVVPVDTGTSSAYELNPASAVARWFSLYSLLALVGGFFFRWYFLDRSLNAVAADKKARGVAQTRWSQLTWVLFIIFAVANLAELALQVQLVAEQFSFVALTNVLLNTRFGTLWLVRVGLMAIAALLLGLNGRRINLPYVIEIATGLGAAALMTRSLLGHSASVPDAWLPIFADWLHLVAVALWVGGLLYFAWLMPFMWRALQDTTRAKWIAWLVPEFSLVAIASAIIIAGTGIYNSRVQIPEIDQFLRGDFSAVEPLLSNLYASSLGIKIVLFAIMLLFGALNLLLLSPRFRAYITEPDKSARVFTRFRITVAAEVLLGLAVVFFAGILTLSPPPRSEPPDAGPAIVQEEQERPVVLFGSPSEDVRVTLEIGPNPNAPEQFKVTATDPDGNPLTDIQRVIFQFMYLNEDAGLQNVNAEPQPDGTYVLDGNYFPLDGMWRIRLTVRQQGKQDAVIDFPYYVANAPAENNDVGIARLFLQESQARMNELTSLRATQALNDGANAVVVSHYEYLAPDKTRFSIEGQGQAIAIGPLQYLQNASGQWVERARVTPFVFPDFTFADTAEVVRFGRTEVVKGVPAQIVLFEEPASLGENRVRYAYWIADDDKRVLQYGMVAQAHFMMEQYRDFDSPDIIIEKPENVVAAPTTVPVASTNTTGSTAIADMVVASPRPRGIITGDLEGDGALVLVVVGVIVLLVGGGGKRTRNARFVMLGIGGASILLGVGLFIDAVNGTIQANVSAPVNMARATPGEITYNQYCAACHGPKGYGDGPGAASLPVQPLDLTVHFFQHDEQYLFQTILNGRGYMPAFGDRLSQDQIVDVLAYVRLLALQARQQSVQPGFTPPAGVTPRPGFTPQP